MLGLLAAMVLMKRDLVIRSCIDRQGRLSSHNDYLTCLLRKRSPAKISGIATMWRRTVVYALTPFSDDVPDCSVIETRSSRVYFNEMYMFDFGFGLR